MFKPTHFRFDHSVQWPGAGPTIEIHADTVREVEDQGDQYTFVHASGTAFKIDKAQVTAYGVWEDDDVPNMPNSDNYPDGQNADDTDASDDDTPVETPTVDSTPDVPQNNQDSATDTEDIDGTDTSAQPIEDPGTGDDTSSPDATDATDELSQGPIGSLIEPVSDEPSVPADDTLDIGVSKKRRKR